MVKFHAFGEEPEKEGETPVETLDYEKEKEEHEKDIE
tara:strand:- start:799 stop:909 length:111 start_codon:yes stop_codon:yes gene_type:complete